MYDYCKIDDPDEFMHEFNNLVPENRALVSICNHADRFAVLFTRIRPMDDREAIERFLARYPKIVGYRLLEKYLSDPAFCGYSLEYVIYGNNFLPTYSHGLVVPVPGCVAPDVALIVMREPAQRQMARAGNICKGVARHGHEHDQDAEPYM